MTKASSLVPLDTLGKEIVACADKGDAYRGKAEQFYKAAGIKLAEAKVRVAKTKGLTWSDFLRINCNGLSRQRANDYLQIADGRKTAKEVTKSRIGPKLAAERAKTSPRGDNRPELPSKIKTSVSSGDITEFDIGANLWQATRAIDLFEGAPDWKKVKKELTKKELDTLVSAIEELKNV